MLHVPLHHLFKSNDGHTKSDFQKYDSLKCLISHKRELHTPRNVRKNINIS